MPRKDDLEKFVLSRPIAKRRQIAPLSQFYDEELQLDAFLTGRSVPDQATTLLQAKLKERCDWRKGMLERLADSRGVSPEVLRAAILGGRLPDLSEQEYAAIEAAIARAGNSLEDE